MDAMIARVSQAIDHIEGHLHEPLTLQDIARVSGLSQYHLHRWFTAIFGYSIKAYVRRRRLTEAAAQLRTTDRDILGIALQCRFQSQAAFTRAFRGFFGIPPARYRRAPAGAWYAGLPRASVEDLVHWRDGITHAPRFATLASPVALAGRRVPFDQESETSIFEAWAAVLAALADRTTPELAYGVVYADRRANAPPSSVDTDLHYLAGVAEAHLGDPTAAQVQLEPGPYAVFEHHGSTRHIWATVDYIWATWLPRSGVVKADRPDFERFCLRDLAPDADDDATVEVWVSIEAVP